MSDTIVVGTRKGLVVVRRDAEGRWAPGPASFLGDPVTAVLVDHRDGTWYAALDHGHFGVKLHRSDDGGETWPEVAAPEYPPQPEGRLDLEPFRQIPIPWSTELIWVLEAAHVDEPGALWAGTIPGGLFRSDDRAESWSLVEPLWEHPARSEWTGGGYDFPGIHTIEVDPRGPGRITIGVSCGGAWTTEDGGATWRVGTGMRAGYVPDEEVENPNNQDIHRLSRCAAEPDVLWGQHHSGMYRSTDGGATFDEITGVQPSTFGFAVAAHPVDPDTAWYVPAISDQRRVPCDGRMVVTRTRDGGRSFSVVGAGLPDHDAYHLVYRHGLAVDETGERLALGSTTGSAWVSEDGGESFQQITADLPPVACVRFA